MPTSAFVHAGWASIGNPEQNLLDRGRAPCGGGESDRGPAQADNVPVHLAVPDLENRDRLVQRHLSGDVATVVDSSADAVDKPVLRL